jgi:hypothetical protein
MLLKSFHRQGQDAATSCRRAGIHYRKFRERHEKIIYLRSYNIREVLRKNSIYFTE